MIRKWDINDEQAQKECIDEVLARIEEQEDTEFGIIATQDIIDIVAEYVGPSAYNAGVEDAKKTMQAKISDLDVELDVLKVSE